MTRREALGLMAAFSGATLLGIHRLEAAGAASAPALGDGSINSPEILSRTDLVLLNEIGETILPATSDSGGAKAANVAGYMEDMVRNIYSEEEQATFTAGLVQLQTRSRGEFSGRGFLDLTASERSDFLLRLERAKPAPEYYKMIKQLALKGYFTSEIGATQAMAHIAVPGHFEGVVTIAPGAKAWSN